MSVETILAEVAAELEYQQQKRGFDDAFDEKNTANDWTAYIAQYLTEGTRLRHPRPMRDAFLKAVALGVAALVAYDRNGGFAPRHYDKT